MKRSGFSMIELVFVIVILGVLAAVAVPRFATTRVDAQVATLRNDIANTLKAVPARVFAENIEITATGYNQARNPNNNTAYTSWGEFILDTAGLDRNRWVAKTNGVIPLAGGNTGGNPNTCHASSVLIEIVTTGAQAGNLRFNPTVIPPNSGTALCLSLIHI